ncbi:unnamed protein product [Lasius platythorax]|uniref:Uncharacterized protein n=1 Tax=Lasius platythorax TaxID=488582 RepID=A0AAV2NKJ1_9HYME
MKELEKKILKAEPYKASSGREDELFHHHVKQFGRDWSSKALLYKVVPPFIMGYTGYIPGFNSSYGLPFMKAVEVGAHEWHETQMKLEVSDAIRAHEHAEPTDPRNLLSGTGTDNVMDLETDHDYDGDRRSFDCHVSPERPPIFGYTGHIPGAEEEVAHSKGFTQAAKTGLEGVQREREERHSAENVHAMQRILDNAYVIDEMDIHVHKLM